MIPVQPVFLTSYFKQKKASLPPTIGANRYLSWEDAVWDLVRSTSIPTGSIVLVPTFFCVDVMNNMKQHGLAPKYYEIDDNLQPNTQDVLMKVKRYKPAMLVLFHAVGITNTCINLEFISKLPQNMFVVEDCVHRVVDPTTIRVYTSRHVIINSFRKVVPLQGSFLFGQKETVNKLQNADTPNSYSFTVIFLWICMQLCFVAQRLIWNTFGELAEWFMLQGYEIIGDEKKPGNCPWIFADLYLKLDFEKIKKVKKEHVKMYEASLLEHALYYVPRMSETDKEELRGYPIVMSKQVANQVITFMRKHGIYIRAELDDSEWTKERSIIYLPLGLHLKPKDIAVISTYFNQAISASN